MSILIIPFYLLIFSVFFAPVARADLNLNYQQSQSFWSILSSIQHGVDTLSAANTLLNRTYGQPEAAQLGIRYSPHTINKPSFSIREFRLDQVGYAVSSNPILPKIYGWEGFGPELTLGWQFLEVYAGKYWAKRAEATSTDLIDRRLLSNEQLGFFGLGLFYSERFDHPAFIPFQLDLESRHTYFMSSSREAKWYHRWRLKSETEFDRLLPNSFPQISALIIGGPQPVPGFDTQGEVWDYVWSVEPNSDPLAMIGIGAKIKFENLLQLTFTGGFFGGYFGVAVAIHPVTKFFVEVRSFATETSTAFQGQGLRMWGVNLGYEF